MKIIQCRIALIQFKKNCPSVMVSDSSISGQVESIGIGNGFKYVETGLVIFQSLMQNSAVAIDFADTSVEFGDVV